MAPTSTTSLTAWAEFNAAQPELIERWIRHLSIQVEAAEERRAFVLHCHNAASVAFMRLLSHEIALPTGYSGWAIDITR